MATSAPFLPGFGVPLPQAPAPQHPTIATQPYPLSHANAAPIPIIPKGSPKSRLIVAGGIGVAVLVLLIALSTGRTEELLVGESFHFHISAIAEAARQNVDAMSAPRDDRPPTMPSASSRAHTPLFDER